MQCPLDIMVANESRDLLTGQVRSAVASLPETERLALRMIHIEGFSEDDTAACLSMTAEKVRRALERAQAMLRQRLDIV